MDEFTNIFITLLAEWKGLKKKKKKSEQENSGFPQYLQRKVAMSTEVVIAYKMSLYILESLQQKLNNKGFR